MWMMGCSSGVSESFSRKVRPHLPRPSNIISPPPYLSRLHSIHGGDHLLLNHHLVSVEQSKRDYDEPALVSSRWNPTPEQLQTLEELYRRGTRTPSADQIQHITAQLRRYGKIEGKNVFYWFQNHKARERMKRRRRSEDNIEDQQLESPHTQNSSDNKEPGASRTSCEAEQTAKNNYWDFSSITPTTPTEEESVSMQNAEKSGGIHFDHQVQQNTRFMNRYPTWQMMPSSSTSSSSTRPIFTVMAEDLNLHITTKNQQESQHTLELFPLQKGDKNGENMDYKDKGLVSNEEMNSNGSAPKQFFEFL